MARKSSEQILAELAAVDDGLPTRLIGLWTLEKLATLLLYFEAFARACRSAGGGYYVDGMAGPGLCQVKDAKQPPFFVWGSPLVALRSEPPFQRGIFLEQNPRALASLQQRSALFGNKAVVRRGDVNSDLVSLIRAEVPGQAPCLCLLDPEGPELEWRTVRSIALLPGRKRKPELLVLFPLDMAILRLLSVSEPMSRENVQRVDAMFGDHLWWNIYQSRLLGAIRPSFAKRSYLDMYSDNVRKLGYHVQSKRIVAPRRWGVRRHEMYHLVFATAHPTGNKIMTDVFKRPFALDFPVTGQRPLDI